MQERGEISQIDAKANIKKAFRALAQIKSEDKGPQPNFYEKRSIKLFATRVIIQAIGRICRTGWKNPDIYIYADNGICECFDSSTCNGFYNIEFLKLAELLKDYAEVKVEPDIFVDAAVTRSNKVLRDIDFMLQTNWNNSTMNRWKLLRDYVISHTTVSTADAEGNPIVQNYYIKAPSICSSLYFKEIGDYKELDVSFEPKKGYRETSAEKANLTKIMQFAPLKKYFESNNYSTEFKANDYIMTPPLWTNIYKGALGEIAGSFLFRDWFKVTLSEIDDPAIFEKFDYQITDYPIFVDFKNWSESFDLKKRETINKILKKAHDCKAKCVIVANVFADARFKLECVTEDGICLLVVPSLLSEEDDSIKENLIAIKKIQEVIHAYSV
ncbi:MAG: hypothetical protein HUK21_02990 [Fibrobacteraceae bacterium]|nr:hypothetical protein [Fibrobacteraceae bacterium]